MKNPQFSIVINIWEIRRGNSIWLGQLYNYARIIYEGK